MTGLDRKPAAAQRTKWSSGPFRAANAASLSERQVIHSDLLRGFERLRSPVTLGLDLRGFLFAELDDVIDQIDIIEPVAGRAVEIDLPMAFSGAAAGEAQVRFSRLAR